MDQIARKLTPSILKIEIEGIRIKAEISDGRIVLIPISWFPRLKSAPPAVLKNFEISPSGYGVHWPDVDEDISIKSFIS
jgi:hypothetical protein